MLIINKYEDLFVVKIYKDCVNNFDIYDMDSILDLFKVVLGKLKDKYDINGLCYIDVYVNDCFGMIIEINNIYKYRGDIDIKVTFHIDSIFMMEINFDEIDDYEDIYYYCDKYYTNYNSKVDSNVIYKDSLDILNSGIRIR